MNMSGSRDDYFTFDRWYGQDGLMLISSMPLWCSLRFCTFKRCHLSHSIMCNALSSSASIRHQANYFCCCRCCVVHGCFGTGSYVTIQSMLSLLKMLSIKLVYCFQSFIFRHGVSFALLFRQVFWWLGLYVDVLPLYESWY